MQTKTFRRVLCTQMTCQNQINLFTVCNEHVYWPIRDGFLRFFQRLMILGADQKDRSLWERDWIHSYISKVMQQCPCSAYFELRQPVTIVSVLELIVIRYFFCLSMTKFAFVSRRCLFTRLL